MAFGGREACAARVPNRDREEVMARSKSKQKRKRHQNRLRHKRWLKRKKLARQREER